MAATTAPSIADIARELSCSTDRATQIMLMELPHVDIRKPGARRATWRAKRKDFEAWQQSRQHRPGREALKDFAQRHMR